MSRAELLLILSLVVAVTVGQVKRGYSYYGTSKVRYQRPQPIYGHRPLLFPRRPMPVTGPVTAAPDATAVPSPVLNGPSTPAAPPTLAAEPEPALQPYPNLQPLGWNPEPTQEIEQAQEPAVLPERNAVWSAPLSINVPQSPTPVALPPLLPKPLHVRELAFGRHLQPSIPPMIYYSTVTYPTQTPSYSYPPTTSPRTIATQAPPVVVTTQSYPAVTQSSGQDFQCKEENGHYSFEHEYDIFIECKQNRAMKYACPDGLHFNPAAKHYEYPCANPSEVKRIAVR